MLNMTMEILGLTIRGMMMVTDEERREVARKLRELSCSATFGTLAEILGFNYYGTWSVSYLADRLADLIEPEPERTITPVLDKSSWYIWRYPECGQPINGADNYCSSCGVKVTPNP